MGDVSFDDLMRVIKNMNPEQVQEFYAELENRRLGGASGFITPEIHAALRTDLQSSRKRLTIAHTPSGRYFARSTIEAYNKLLEQAESDPSNHLEALAVKGIRFGEGEGNPRVLDPVDGNDVFLFTAAYDPNVIMEDVEHQVATLKAQGFLEKHVMLDDLMEDRTGGEHPTAFDAMAEVARRSNLNDNLLTTYLYIRTLKENNAGHITVVMPYFAYGRQNRPTSYRREGTHARTAGDLLFEAGADGLVTYDPHATDLHGFLPPGITKKLIDPFSQMCQIFSPYRNKQGVAFAYLDDGCAKRYGKLVEWLGVPEIFVSTIRGDTSKETKALTGALDGIHTVLFADDIVGSGTTLVKALSPIRAYGVSKAVGATSHALLSGSAPRVLMELYDMYDGNFELNIQDSMPQPERILDLPMIREWHLGGLHAKIVNAIHYQQSASQFAHVFNGERPT